MSPRGIKIMFLMKNKVYWGPKCCPETARLSLSKNLKKYGPWSISFIWPWGQTVHCNCSRSSKVASLTWSAGTLLLLWLEKGQRGGPCLAGTFAAVASVLVSLPAWVMPRGGIIVGQHFHLLGRELLDVSLARLIPVHMQTIVASLL